MPEFNNLMGFKDFGEALFAESRRLDDVRTQHPSYSYAQQGKLADLESAVNELRRESTTGGVSVSVPVAVELTADALGVLDGGQLPFDLEVGVELLGIDALADARTEVVFTPYGVTGAETSEGVFQVTAVNQLEASVKVVVDFATVRQGEWSIPIKVVKDTLPPPAPAPTPTPTPPPGSPPPPPPVVTPEASLFLNGIGAAGFTLLGSMQVNGGFTYRATLNSAFAAVNPDGDLSNIEAYVGYKADGGNWVLGPVTAGTPTTVLAYNFYQKAEYWTVSPESAEQIPGFINLSQDLVLPSGLHHIGFFGKLSYGPAVNLLGPALVQPV